MTAFQVGDYGLARSALAHALARATPDDTWSMALAETWGCLLAHALGDNAEAERLFRAGLAHYRSLGNPRGLVFCLSFGSITLLASRKLEEAQTLLRESLMLASIDNDRFGMAMTMQHLGLVALEQQDAAEAVYLFREALELMRATGSRWDMARVLNQFGAALWLAGASADAGKTYREALAIALEAQATPDALQALAGLAAQLHHAGRPAAALAFAARILADPASRIETRDQAEHIRAALIHQLPAEQIAAIERQARDQPLAALVQAMRTGG
jgi:tetratricopeptide (TPR) repeat protein